MNSAISFSSPDSSGSDNIDWLAHTEGLYPDSGVQTDIEYPGSCALTSELMSELLQTDKQIENQCYPVDPSLPIYSQHPHTEYDPHNSSPLLAQPHTSTGPYPFDSEQMRLVQMRREYQKMLLDIEKKIIENKISWIDQAARSDQMMMCQDPPCPIMTPTPPATVPFSTHSDMSPDKISTSFPIFHQEVPPRSPLNFANSQTQAQHFPSHPKTHKTPVRRNSGSRMQPYFNHSSEAKEGVGEVGGVKKRQSHNAIEERYRKRINSRIQELKSIVAPDEPLPKSNILAKALAYIRDLEEKNRLLEEKVTGLAGHSPSLPDKASSPGNSFKLSSSQSPPAPFQPHKPRSSVKLLLCLLTILLCLSAPDPISLRELPSAFPSWDTVGGLGRAGFRSRTLLYFGDTSISDPLQPSLSLLHPFTLLSWSVRLSLICLSLGVLAYSARVPLPRSLSADPSHFIKLYAQASVEFRENRLSQSLAYLETALGQLGVTVEVSRARALLSLFIGALFLFTLKLIRSSYLRIITRAHGDSGINPTLVQEAICSLHLAQRVQADRGQPLCSVYAALTAHTLALSYHSLTPLYLLQYSQSTLLTLLSAPTSSLLERCVLTMVRKLTCSADVTSQQHTMVKSLSLWSQEVGDLDLDREIQTQVFCAEFTNLLKSILSTEPTQERPSSSKIRFSLLVQSLPPSRDELTRWWAAMGLFAADWRQGVSSAQLNCSLLFKSIPPHLLASSYILPKALILACKFRISVHSSPLHRPTLLARLSEEATELVWSSVQLDSPPADNRELFSLLQALCCDWLLDGLAQIWQKSSCLHIQHCVSQSYMSGLFILGRLAETHSLLSNFLAHYSSLAPTLSCSNPRCQLDCNPQPVTASNGVTL